MTVVNSSLYSRRGGNVSTSPAHRFNTASEKAALIRRVACRAHTASKPFNALYTHLDLANSRYQQITTTAKAFFTRTCFVQYKKCRRNARGELLNEEHKFFNGGLSMNVETKYNVSRGVA